MNPLRQWIEEEQEKTPREIAQDTYIYSRSYGDGLHDGWLKAMKHVLRELKAREEAEKEQAPEILELADRARKLHEGAWSILMALKEKCLKLAAGSSEKVTWWGGRPHVNKKNIEPIKKEIIALADEGIERVREADTVAHDLVLQALHWRGHLMSVMSGRITYKEAVELMRELGIADIQPSNPGRFTDRIRDLRRDLSVAGDAEERSRISQELLDAQDEYREYTGITKESQNAPGLNDLETGDEIHDK